MAVGNLTTVKKLSHSLAHLVAVRHIGTDFGERGMRAFGIFHDLSPLFRHTDTHHAGTVTLLVGPESIADIVVDHHLDEIGLPLVRVVADLTHIHRTVRIVTEINIALDGLGSRLSTITMAGIHQLRVIEINPLERREIAVPLRRTDEDDMILVHFADNGDGTLIEVNQFGIQFVAILKMGCDRLIYKFIAKYHRFILIARRYALPNISELLLRHLALHEPGITV